MSQTYNDVFRRLYDEFGEELIGIGKEELLKRLQSLRDVATPSEPIPVVADESYLAPEDADISYHDAGGFERQFTASMNAQAVAVIDSKNVVEALTFLVRMAGEVAKFESAQQTVRAGIAAERDAAIANIEMQKTLLMEYLDKSFDERRENFQKLFTVVDDALEKDNIQQLALGLDSILKLAETSPFKDLSSIETATTALNNPNHQWDF